MTKYEDDISVLVLAEEVDLAQWPHIKPACLPGPGGGEGQWAGSKAVVSGWGLTDFYKGSYPQHLREGVNTDRLTGSSRLKRSKLSAHLSREPDIDPVTRTW